MPPGETGTADISPFGLPPWRSQSGANAEALAEYEATLGKEPNRLRVMLGAARAAEAAGQAEKAGAYRRRAAELAPGATPRHFGTAVARPAS